MKCTRWKSTCTSSPLNLQRRLEGLLPPLIFIAPIVVWVTLPVSDVIILEVQISLVYWYLLFQFRHSLQFRWEIIHWGKPRVPCLPGQLYRLYNIWKKFGYVIMKLLLIMQQLPQTNESLTKIVFKVSYSFRSIVSKNLNSPLSPKLPDKHALSRWT